MKYDIEIDYSRDSLFDELGLKRLRESYMRPEEKSPQERFAYVASEFASNQAHAQRLYDYVSKHWLSMSTPILSYGRNKNGLPISCYLSYIPDTAKGLVDSSSEVKWLSMLGGGVGIHLGIRSADDKSVGIMPHLKSYDADSLAYKQGTTRRGSFAAYLDIDHPDIIQFLEMRKVTGDHNMRTPNLNHGINVTDKFMRLIQECMINPNMDDTWELIQPSTGKVVDTVSAKHLWISILETRMQRGEPYIHFIDTANDALPQEQKNLGLKIRGSNLCTEIFLATDEDRTAVCCLSSKNLMYYDLWADDYQFHKDVAEMLDNALDRFIALAPGEIFRAAFSAFRERSIGIGVLGFHSYLQSQNIPFESTLAKSLNNRIFKKMKIHLDRANKELALERGACPDSVEGGDGTKRFMHTMAIAPTASTSIIMGNISPGPEPIRANAYRQDTTSGAYFTRNPILVPVLEKLCVENKHDLEETWSSIVSNDGSIQHLEWIPADVREVFKTAMEIDQRWVVDLAADRQVFIDQGQSINIFLPPDAHIKYLHAVHFQAWVSKLKSLYYVRSDKLRKADKVGNKVERKRIEDEIDMESLANEEVCIACQ